MPFDTPTDRFRLSAALQLESSQDAPTSTLQTLMDQLDGRDLSYGSSRATEIQAWLTEIESLDAADAAALATISGAAAGAAGAGDTIKSLQVQGEYLITYDTDSSSGSTKSDEAKRAKARRSLRQKITRWLDPYNYLSRYISNGRAIDGA